MLKADPDYYKMSRKKRNKITNGCGPSGWLKNDGFAESCRIHDFDYSPLSTQEASKEHRRKSDKRFLKNMLKEANLEPRWWKRNLLKIKARIYYTAVKVFGKLFYKKGKRN